MLQQITSIGAYILRMIYTFLVLIFVFTVMFYRFLRRPIQYFQRKKRKLPPALAKPDCGEHGFYDSARLRYHYVANGEQGKPLMLFLHGFPEFWYSWRFQLKEFGQDYFAVAVDNRGFGDTERPVDLESYDITELIEDVREIINGLGYSKCIIVAHDWGGIIAWHFAHTYPEYIDRLITINAPHPTCFRKYLQSHFSQLMKSWYFFFYQLPVLPEFFSKALDCGVFDQIMATPIRADPKTKDMFTDEDLDCYKYMFLLPGAFTAALNYYRRNVFSTPMQFKYEKVIVPTLVIWGDRDGVLDTAVMYKIGEYVDTVIVKLCEGATHWVNQQYPDRTNKLIRTFLRQFQK